MNSSVIELPLVPSNTTKLRKLTTLILEIHGIARTDDTNKCIVIHGPTSNKYLVDIPYDKLVKDVYGFRVFE